MKFEDDAVFSVKRASQYRLNITICLIPRGKVKLKIGIFWIFFNIIPLYMRWWGSLENIWLTTDWSICLWRKHTVYTSVCQCRFGGGGGGGRQSEHPLVSMLSMHAQIITYSFGSHRSISTLSCSRLITNIVRLFWEARKYMWMHLRRIFLEGSLLWKTHGG